MAVTFRHVPPVVNSLLQLTTAYHHPDWHLASPLSLSIGGPKWAHYVLIEMPVTDVLKEQDCGMSGCKPYVGYDEGLLCFWRGQRQQLQLSTSVQKCSMNKTTTPISILSCP